MQIIVEHYSADRVPNPNPAGETSYEEFWRVRQEVATVCRRYGITGPDDRQQPPACWVVDDQYSHDLYQYIEVYDRAFLSSAWLYDLMGALQGFAGWGAGIGNIRFAYLLVFGNKLMVTGHAFADCEDVESVAATTSANLWGVNGEEERITSDRWHRAELLASDICGCYYCCTMFSPSDIVEWNDVDDDDPDATAVCPNCGRTKVIAAKPPFRLERAALMNLSKLAFGPLHARSAP
jgi:hypothetical protein